MDACLAEKEGDVADKTYKRFSEGLDHFKRYAGVDIPVREASVTTVVIGFRASRRRDGAAKATVNDDLGGVSVLSTYCIVQGWIDQRPKIKRYKIPVRIRYLGSNQIVVYMANVRQAFRLLFQLLIGTGLRYGEAAGLSLCLRSQVWRQ